MYERGLGVPQDNAEAVRYRLAAGKGVVRAQYNLGRMHYHGAKALRWFGDELQQRPAAFLTGRQSQPTPFPSLARPDQGHVKAQSQLGLMYLAGHGVLLDFAEALRWFRPAADKGDLGAQVGLACMYEKGQGVKTDYAEALRLYRLAVAKGSPSRVWVRCIRRAAYPKTLYAPTCCSNWPLVAWRPSRRSAMALSQPPREAKPARNSM